MANPLYTRLRATAVRLIDKYGKDATVVVPGAKTGPAHNPTVGAPTNVPCKLVETGEAMTRRNQTLIQLNDRIGIISPEAAVTQDCKLLLDGEPYNLAGLEPLNPGGLLLLYEFVARK